MSNPSTEHAPNMGRRPDPATATREELLAYFAVDPTKGLGGREADRRRDRSVARPLFGTTARSYRNCVLSALREPILWIMLAISVIALFFNREAIGLVCLTLTVAHILLCAYFSYRAARVDATMQRAYDAPLARVLRSGRICRVGAEAVVEGDILLVYRGDLIPADCRLLRTDGFAVSERELDTTNPDRPTHYLEKDADASAAQTDAARVSPPHMVYAGAVAETGFAVALVVAVGSNTHVGSLLSDIRPAHGTRVPAAQKVMAKVASIFSIALVILLIPLVVLGIFMLGDKHDFFDIFLSALALCTLGVCELTVAKLAYLSASIRRDAALARDAVNRADVRAAADAERLSTLTDLLLLDTSALDDGVPHPAGIWYDGTSYPCDLPDANAEATLAVEYLYIWQYGRALLPAYAAVSDRRIEETVRALVPSLCEWAETDTEALLVKFKDIRPEENGVSAILPTAQGNRRVRITVTANVDDLPARAAEKMSDARREARESGLSILYIIATDADGKESNCSMLTYAPYTCPKTVGWIKSMEAAGIRVSALMRGSGPESIRTLDACGLCERYSADLPTADRRIADRIAGGLRAFVGCTDQEITACIRDLQADGRTVGVLSVEAGHISHLNAADVAFTCAPSAYAAAEAGFLRPVQDNVSPMPDGLSDADRATDLCRRRADVVVRRTSREGGGLGGVRTALLTADRTRQALSAASAYLLLAGALRLLMVILSFAFGLLPIPAPILMLSGWLVDTLVLIFFARVPANSTPSPRRPMTEGLDRPWYVHRVRLVCLCVIAALPWVVAFVARLLAADVGDGLGGYALLCLVGMQTALYLSLRPRRRDRSSASAFMTLVLIYVGALAAALGMGLHPLYAILIPPVPALLYVATSAFVRRFDRYPA